MRARYACNRRISSFCDASNLLRINARDAIAQLSGCWIPAAVPVPSISGTQPSGPPSSSSLLAGSAGDKSRGSCRGPETAIALRLDREIDQYDKFPDRAGPMERLTPTPLHSDADIVALVTGLADVWTRLALHRAA